MAEDQDTKSYLLLGTVFLVIVALAVAVSLVEQRSRVKNRLEHQTPNAISSTASAPSVAKEKSDGGEADNNTTSAMPTSPAQPAGKVHPTEVTEATFSAQVLKSKIPVIVDFYATWCGPCKQLAPIVDQIADEQRGKIKVVRVDVDKNEQLVNQYRVDGYPTLVYIHHGKEVDRSLGLVPREDILQRIKQIK